MNSNESIKIYNKALKIFNSELDWKDKYDLIFSEDISLKFNFEWYDPDTSYEEDITAFMSALTEYMKKIIKIENILR
jgi:hypothetical protein